MTSPTLIKPSSFSNASRLQESHKETIYCVDWSTDVYYDDDDDDDASNDNDDTHSHENEGNDQQSYRVLATCALQYVNVYQVRKGNAPMELIQTYQHPGEESFYAIVFAGRCVELSAHENEEGSMSATDSPALQDEQSSHVLQSRKKEPVSPVWPLSGETGTGPQYICAGGQLGTISVIDTVRQELVATLVGHGNDIYDLKRCPADEFIIASAGKDNTTRLWNLKTGAQVAVFLGHESHLDDVVSIAWHASGNYLATASMDTTVKVWDVGPNTPAHEAIQQSHQAAANLFDAEEPFQIMVSPTEQHIPVFTSEKIHFYCVDCVAFVGDYIMSKSQENRIILWEPIYLAPQGTPQVQLPHPVPNQHKHIRTFEIKSSEMWFVRFGIDHDGRMLAMSNDRGDLMVWDLRQPKPHPLLVLNKKRQGLARFISFSPDNDMMVAVFNGGSVAKWNIRWEDESEI